MEQLLLNLFQEHLSKFIIGFRKEQVNANLFNGKGEISDMELNCSVLNEQLRHITPYIELERIHISNISFHVRSWTNLRHSPIRVDIDHIHVTMTEPLHYETDVSKRKRIRQVTMEELTQLMKDGILPKPRQSSYNLLDRILDNLVMEIRSIHITYQPCGILKTRRTGPWTPPTLLIQLFGIQWMTIDEYGNEIKQNNPNSNNNNNNSSNHSNNKTDTATSSSSKPQHQHHHRSKKDGSFYIYKRLAADYQISLILTQPKRSNDADHNNRGDNENNFGITNDPSSDNNTDTTEQEYDKETIIPIISSSTTIPSYSSDNNSSLLDPRKKMNLQFTIQRRIRDGEYLAVQLDMIIPLVEVLLLKQKNSTTTITYMSTEPSNAQKLSAFVQFITAVQFCLMKDRSFMDPLRPNGSCGIPQQPSLSVSESKTENNDTHKDTSVAETMETSTVLVEEASATAVLSTDAADEVIPSALLDLTLADGLSDSSSSSDEDDDADDDIDDDDENDAVDKSPRSSVHDEEVTATSVSEESDPKTSVTSTTTVATAQPKPIEGNRPVILPTKNCGFSSGRRLLVFSNGIIVHDKFSFSVNIHEIQLCGQYDTIDGDIQVHANGIVTEVIWPIVTKEKGVYLQTSISSFSLYERYGHRMRSLLKGGRNENVHSKLFENALKQEARETRVDNQNFPPYEDRSVRPDTFALRQQYPHQSFGSKLTVSLTKKRRPSPGEEDKEELVIFPEVAFDEVEINLDANAWSRIAQYFLNLNCGRYDQRWWTGDYRNTIGPAMLIHPSAAFMIEDCLQVSELQVQGKSSLPSFENFNSTVHMANIVMCLPAVTDNNILTCDVVVRCSSIITRISSDLPRSLMNDAPTTTIEFPNDPSDIALQRQQSEESVTMRNDGMSSKVSTIGCHVTYVGLSVSVIPIVPLCLSSKPEHLLLPTDGLLRVRLEALVETNIWKSIEVDTQIALDQFEVNLDLEMLASAAITAMYHYKIITEINESYSLQLSSESIATDKLDTRIVTDKLDTQNMCAQSQIVQCWKDGKVVVCFDMSFKTCRVSMWRQNIPRHHHARTKVYAMLELSPILMLADFIANDTVISCDICNDGIQKRTIGKLRARELCVGICDFDRILSVDTFWVDYNKKPTSSQVSTCEETPMVQILSLGLKSSCRALDVRVEEDKSDTCSYTFAADFADGLIDTNVELVSATILLIFEALLMPCQALQTAPLVGNHVSHLFPDGTVGHLFALPISPKFAKKDISIGSKALPSDESSLANIGIDMKSLLESYITKIEAFKIDVLLIRVGIKKMQALISDRSNSSDIFRIGLLDSSMILSHFSSDSSKNQNILDRVAAKQVKWSTLIDGKTRGLYHEIKSRQSIHHLIKSKGDTATQVGEDITMSLFDFIYSYYDAKVSVTISDDSKLGGADELKKFAIAAYCLLSSYKAMLRRTLDVSRAKLALSNRHEDHEESLNGSAGPIQLACASTTSALVSLKNLSLVMKEKVKLLTNATESYKRENANVVAKLRMQLLLKENERLGIHASVSSVISGWLRSGTAQRSGLRGSMSCTLWHQWVILRRSVLLFYASPGQYGTVDIVSLEGASLHEVSGGNRKIDLKRAFALVDKTGTIYLLIAGCDGDYIAWVHAIANAINVYAINDESYDSLNESVFVTPNQVSSHLDSSAASIDDSSNHGGKFSRSLAKVVHAAKAKGQAVVAKSIGQLGQPSEKDFGGEIIPASPSKRTESLMSNSTASVNDGGDPRIQQMRNRLAGVGQVTKSRIGNALLAAKQKGKEVAQKRRPVTTIEPKEVSIDVSYPRGNEQSTAESTAEAWTCSTCTFVNIRNEEKCEMCKSLKFDTDHDLETVGPNVSSVSKVQNPKLDLMEDASCSGFVKEDRPRQNDDNDDDQRVASNFLDDDELKSQNGIKKRFSAVVRRAKIATSERQRLGWQSGREDSQHDATVTSTPAQKINNVGLVGPLKVPSHPFGEGTNHTLGLPLKQLDGIWFIKVKLCTDNMQDSTSKDLCNMEDDTNRQEKDSVVSQVANDMAEGSTNSFMDLGSRPNSDDTNEFVDLLFKVDVLKYNLADDNKMPFEVIKTLSDIAAFHATLSESISQVPPNLFDASTYQKPAEAPTSYLYGGTILDKVRTSGKLLSELLDLQAFGSTRSESVMKHYAFVIAEFLNDVVNSPLPVDSVASVADFLKLSDCATNNYRSDMSHFGPTSLRVKFAEDESNPTKESLSDLSTFISHFYTELDRASNQNHMAATLWHSRHSNFEALDMSVSSSVHCALSIPSYQFRDAINTGLREVMIERDEAYSRLVHCETLRNNEMDLQSIVVKDMSLKLASLKGEKSTNIEKNLGKEETVTAVLDQRHDSKSSYDADAELQSLCQQLAGEISARTAAEMEIVRLKESRKIEQDIEASDRQVLQREVVQLQELLQQKIGTEVQILQESKMWRESFEAVVQCPNDETEANSSSTRPV